MAVRFHLWGGSSETVEVGGVNGEINGRLSSWVSGGSMRPEMEEAKRERGMIRAERCILAMEMRVLGHSSYYHRHTTGDSGAHRTPVMVGIAPDPT